MASKCQNYRIASQANYEAKKFRNLKLKLLNLDKSIWFNKTCLDHNLTPNYIPLRNTPSSNAAKRSFNSSRKIWIKNEIKFAQIKKQQINRQLIQLHLKLSNSWHKLEWEAFTDSVHNEMKSMAIIKHTNLVKKIDSLKNKNGNDKENSIDTTKQHDFYDRVVVRTGTAFNTDEMKLLEKGLKFNCQDIHTTQNVKQLVTDIEIACEKLPATEKEITKNVAVHIAKKFITKEKNQANKLRHTQQKSLKSIKQKIKDEDLIITKADKGNTVVVMGKSEYQEKTLQFLNNNDVTEIKKDPTNIHQTAVKRTLKNTDLIFTEKEKQRIVNPNPKLPTLRSLPKIHKEDCPIRPIVNFKNAPAYQLSKELQKILKNKVTLDNNKSIKNTSELIENLKSVPINETTKMVSFDITNMYANVNKHEAINIIQSHLQKTHSPQETKEIIALLKTALDQNTFRFEDKIYKQPNGLAMGSPLSGILADIFMNKVENTFLASKSAKGIIHWNRYVDDVICLYDSDITSADKLLDEINKTHQSIIFTMEKETDSKLNYLDLTLNRQANKISFSIHRKKTHTSHTIDATSNHPISQKLAGLQTMTHRAVKLPISKSNQNTEKVIIKQIAHENNFNPKVVDRMLAKQQNIRAETPRTNPQEGKYVRLNFVNNNSYKIANLLKQKGLKVAFKTNNSLQKHLNNINDAQRDPYSNSGIYKLQCTHQGCNADYVGMTKRSFHIRYKEHRNAIKHNKFSAFCNHIYDENHRFTDIKTDLKILHYENRYKQLNIKEAIEINLAKKHSTNNLNEHTTLRNSPLYNLLT